MPLLVCATTGHFADDVSGRCAACSRPIVHRPHVDPSFVMVCEGCAASILEQPETQIAVTLETLREVALWNAKTKGTQ